MKKDYVSPASSNIGHRNTADTSHVGMGGTSVGTDTMHANSEFFDEEIDEDHWAHVGNLWDVE